MVKSNSLYGTGLCHIISTSSVLKKTLLCPILVFPVLVVANFSNKVHIKNASSLLSILILRLYVLNSNTCKDALCSRLHLITMTSRVSILPLLFLITGPVCYYLVLMRVC